MTDRKPRPTEYKGIRYRSKSEACFARFLDDYHLGGFSYEPEWVGFGDYVPDFMHSWIEQNTAGRSYPCIRIIEYKPKRPTDTYIAEFFKERTPVMSDYFSGVPFVKFQIAIGTFWSPDNMFYLSSLYRKGLSHGGIKKEEIYPGKYLHRVASAIKSYRFDLEQPSKVKAAADRLRGSAREGK